MPMKNKQESGVTNGMFFSFLQCLEEALCKQKNKRKYETGKLEAVIK